MTRLSEWSPTSVRGTFVLNTFDYIREHFGQDAQRMVMRRLPESLVALVDSRDRSWVPLHDLVTCMRTAKALLAPEDDFFYRDIGSYGGRHLRTLWLGILFSEPARPLQCCKLLWRTFVDSGHLEVIPSPGAATLRIHDLPVAAPFCERLLGSFEGLFSVAAKPMHIEKRACTSRGDPYCEMQVSREPPRLQSLVRRASPRMESAAHPMP